MSKWSSYINLVGPAGIRGVGLHSGSANPTADAPASPMEGDFFLNTSSTTLFGPFSAATGWPVSGASLIGPQGAASTVAGPVGPPGAQLRYGAGAPSSAIGVDGSFYIDSVANALYGPKASGSWSTSSISLVGPPGPKGDASTVPGPAGPPGPDVFSSQSVGIGPGFAMTGTLSAAPLGGLIPGTTIVRTYAPTIGTAFMGMSYVNYGAACTLTLYDQTAGAAIYSAALPTGVAGNLGQFSTTQYPMPANHSYVWQLTGTGSLNISADPLYLYPAATPTYNVSSTMTCGIFTSTTFTSTQKPVTLPGGIGYCTKLPKASSVYYVAVTNNTASTLTLRWIQNINGVAAITLTAPANAQTTFGPYAIGTYPLVSSLSTGATGQYYWTATGTGTGTFYIDAQVAFSIA